MRVVSQEERQLQAVEGFLCEPHWRGAAGSLPLGGWVCGKLSSWALYSVSCIQSRPRLAVLFEVAAVVTIVIVIIVSGGGSVSIVPWQLTIVVDSPYMPVSHWS